MGAGVKHLTVLLVLTILLGACLLGVLIYLVRWLA